jgi:predicted GIY-YIG superfamily endonuclease
MYYVYVLKSQLDGIRYVGSTVDVMKRLHEHNNGKNRFTKGHQPWELVHSEKFDTRGEAMKREYFLKSGQGRKWLDAIIS